MATIRCPQCGTDIQDAQAQFCPNPNCGFPLSFSKPPEEEDPQPAMERRPLEKAPVTPTQPPPGPTAPVTPTPVVPPPPPTPPTPKKGGPNPALLIAAVLVAVAAIAAAAIFFAGGDDEEPPADRPGAAGDSELVFTQVAVDALDEDLDQRMHRVVAGDDQLIAVGSHGTEGTLDAAVWRSPDGESWSRVPPGPELEGDGEQEMLGISKAPNGYVIVGEDTGRGDAAVWTSDGVNFDRIGLDDDALAGEGDQKIARVLRGGPGLLAVGRDYNPETADGDAGLWESVDGTRWQRATFQEELGGDGEQEMRSIVKFGDGFVGAGREQVDGDWDAAVWKSSSGTAFEQRLGTTEETFGGSGQQQIYTVAADGPRLLVAVGTVRGPQGNPDAAVWVSRDGDSWERLENDAVFGGPGTQLMLGVTPTPAGLIAVGYDGAAAAASPGVEPEPFFDGAMWHSDDGLTWERLPSDSFGGDGEQQIKNVVLFGDTIVAVGWDGSRGDLDAAVWTAPLPD